MTDRASDREMEKCELSRLVLSNGKVCKTFIRRFDPDPRLQLESSNLPFSGLHQLPADSSKEPKKHRNAHVGPSHGRTATLNGPTPSSSWRRIVSAPDAGDAPGVYVLICHGWAVYVGQSLRLVERLRSHKWRFEADGIRTRWGFYPGAYVKVRECRRFGEWLAVEARLIRRLSPLENIRALSRARQRVESSRDEDGSITIDLSRLYAAPAKTTQNPAPEVEAVPKPPGWGVRPCGCGRLHEMSYAAPRVDCACGWWLELVTPSPSEVAQ